MSLHRFSTFASSVLLLVAAASAPVGTARAGDVSNAQLGCYVDTYAFDYPTDGECYGFWTPYSATNPSTAVFEVSGLTPGSYTFYWTDLNTGQSGVCGTGDPWCFRTIYVNGSKTLQVTVVDNQTNASKTMVATAYYLDGWN